MNGQPVSTPPSRLDATHHDVAVEIHRVMMAAYQVEAELLGVADFFPLRRTVAQIAAAGSQFFGLFVEDRLTAVAEVEPQPTATNIAALVVAPDHFRKGFASALLRSILELYADRDLTVSTGALNRPALLLYEKLGFRKQRRWSTPDGIPMVTLLRGSATQPGVR